MDTQPGRGISGRWAVLATVASFASLGLLAWERNLPRPLPVPAPQRGAAPVEVDPTPDTAVKLGKSRALIFATDTYSDAVWPSLDNPIRDAERLKRVLIARYGFEVELIKNPKAKDFPEVIERYVGLHYERGDQLLVFVAGHGEYREQRGHGYIAASDSERYDERMTHNNIRSMVNRIPCDHILVILDVCFGGTFEDEQLKRLSRKMRGAHATVEEMVARKLRFRTRRYLTSGGREYVPDESQFADALITTLETPGKKGYVGLLDLRLAMERLVPEPRAGAFGHGNEANSDFLFVVQN